MANDREKMLDGNGNNLNTGSFASFAQTMNNNAAIDNGNPAQMLRGALGSAPKLGDAVGVNAGGLPEGDTATGAEIGTGGTGSDSGTAVQAQPISGIPLYSGSVGSYEDWMSKNGYDPDTDYKDAQAELEYNYMTSMANYGRRAEELSQMGLSNSGLSDIYQLGAYNSYLKSQNDLANALIAEKKKYRQEYNALLKEEETAKKTDTANAYNTGLDLLAYEEDGTSNADYVRQQLINRGYDASVVDSAMQMLMGLDKDTLPVMKQRAQEKKEASEQRERDIASAVSTWLAEGYTTSMAKTVEDALTAEGKDAAFIKEVIDRLAPYGKENVKRADESDISTALASIIESGTYDGDPTERAKIENLYTALGWNEEKVKAFMKRLDDAIPQKTDDQIKEEKASDVAKITAELEATYGKYGWGERTKEQIRQAYAGTEYEKYLDAAFEKHKENVASLLNSEASDLEGALDADSANSDELFANAYEILGIEKSKWDSMDDEDKTFEILVGLSEIDEERGKTAFESWYGQSLADIAAETDGNNMLDMTDQLIEQIEELQKKGVISRDRMQQILEGEKGENGLRAFRNALKDAEIRGTIHDVGVNAAGVLGTAAAGAGIGMLITGPAAPVGAVAGGIIGLGLGVAGQVGAAIVNDAKGEKQAWE